MWRVSSRLSCEHICTHVTAECEHSIEVDLENLRRLSVLNRVFDTRDNNFVPVLVWKLMSGMSSLDTSAIDQDV